jgi:hypothetical protein
MPMNNIKFESASDGAIHCVRSGYFDFDDERFEFKYIREEKYFKSIERKLYVNGALRINEAENILSSTGIDIGKLFNVSRIPWGNKMEMVLRSGKSYLLIDNQTYRDENGYQICLLGEKSYWMLPMEKGSCFALPCSLFPYRRFKKMTKNLEQSDFNDVNLLLLSIYYLCLFPMR